MRDTREITGRNLESGNRGEGRTGREDSWLGAIGYFTVLDQIGKCYRTKNKERLEGNNNSVYKALKYFTRLTEKEINAIYALRNAFVHDYGLYNINKKPQLTHHFTATGPGYTTLVALPNEQWDGIASHKKIVTKH